MNATGRTFAVTVTIDEADTAKTADQIRRALEEKGITILNNSILKIEH